MEMNEENNFIIFFHSLLLFTLFKTFNEMNEKFIILFESLS